jgi:hypothetical protein
MLRNLHVLNTTQDLTKLDESLATKNWVEILNHFGGSDS